MEGNVSQVFAKCVSALAGNKIYKPSKSYHAANDVEQKYIRCSLKANDGFLFPMEKFFVFIYKPSTVMRFEVAGRQLGTGRSRGTLEALGLSRDGVGLLR